jgi:formate dehydrogenase alpha subunit
MGHSSNKVIDVNPAHLAESVNRATLCVRGHFAHDFLNSGRRMIAPLMPQSGENDTARMAPVSWDKALNSVVDQLRRVKNESGPQSIAFMGSSKCSNEENYLFQKIARTLIGTNNVDNGGYVSGQFLVSILDQKTGGGCRLNRLDDLEKADIIMVLGADPNHSLPVVSYYLKRAAKNGVPMIVVDPRKTELVGFASQWLAIRPQADLELVNALAALLHEKGACDSEFIERYTEGFSQFSQSLSSIDMERVCKVTGLQLQQLDVTAALLKEKRIAFVIGHGILQQRYGTPTLGAILNLSLMTGNLGAPGAGIYILARENNQNGAMDMGAVPGLLPGRMPLAEDSTRNAWEKNWGMAISGNPGFNMGRVIEEAENGRLKALYIMGENLLHSLPQAQRVKAALEKLEFLVVQDILDSEIVQLADVALAGAAASEKSGSFTNLEGRIQSFSPVVSPPGKAKPDWEILDLLAARLGEGEAYGTIEKIREEIRQMVPAYAGMNGQGSGWIDISSPMAAFGAEGAREMLHFSPVVSTTDDPADSEYPFTAILGSLRYHLGSGTRTSASGRIEDFDSIGDVAISSADAHRLDLKDGDVVKIETRQGAIERKIECSPRMSAGQLFVPLGVNANDAMNLIELSDLANPDTTGWKTCAARLKKA